MNNSIVIGTVLGVTVAMAGGVFAGYQLIAGHDRPAPRMAAPLTVLAMPAALPAPECAPIERRDGSRITGTVVGALAGAAVGKDVGDRDITTAAGAVAGAAAGNHLQRRIQDNRAAHAC